MVGLRIGLNHRRIARLLVLMAAVPISDPASRHPVRFREGSAQMKPAYTPLTSLLDGHLPGVALGDYDNDGDLDIYLTNNGAPSTTWELLAPAASRPGPLARAAFLYRNDGDPDGDGLPNFTDVTAATGTDDLPGIGGAALFVDLDNDGDLDLVVANKLRGITFSEFGFHAPDQGIDFPGLRDSKKVLPIFTPDTPNGQLNGEFVVGTDPKTGQPRGEGRNTLYRNLLKETGQARFEDITDRAGEIGGTSKGLPGGRSSNAVVAADVDQDGFLDLYFGNMIDPDFWALKPQVGPKGESSETGKQLFSNGQLNELFHNNGDMTFTDVTEQAGVGGSSPTFYDYNGEARQAYSPDLRDAAGKPVGEPAPTSWGAAFSDFDLDGRPDIWVASDTPGHVELYRNDTEPDKPIKFTPIGRLSGVAQIGQWMGIATGDLDRDGDFDVFIANFGGSCYARTHNVDAAKRTLEDDVDVWNRWQGNANLHALLSNDGVRQVRHEGKLGKAGIFPNVVQSAEVTHSRWLPPRVADPTGISPQKGPLFGLGPYEFAWGAVMFDADSDGWLDLYFAGSLEAETEENPGRLLISEGPFRFVDLSVEAHALNISKVRYDNVDAGRPPEPEDRILQEPNKATNEIAGAIATGDLNGDGFEDLVVVNTGGFFFRRPNPPRMPNGMAQFQAGGAMLFINQGTQNHWLRLRLEGAMRPGDPKHSGKSNRMAVGARVVATLAPPEDPGLPVVRELAAGGSLEGQSSPELHFGLGKATKVSRLEVHWPSGKVQELGEVAADQILLVREGDSQLTVIRQPKVKP
jgi:hypothetical protein